MLTSDTTQEYVFPIKKYILFFNYIHVLQRIQCTVQEAQLTDKQTTNVNIGFFRIDIDIYFIR